AQSARPKLGAVPFAEAHEAKRQRMRGHALSPARGSLVASELDRAVQRRPFGQLLEVPEMKGIALGFFPLQDARFDQITPGRAGDDWCAIGRVRGGKRKVDEVHPWIAGSAARCWAHQFDLSREEATRRIRDGE